MKKRVLVVEDNELNRAMLSEILSDSYRVMEAGNGQEALDILRQCKDNVSLILLDIMMPVMDGYTFLDRIKSDAELSLIPVIAMTQGDSEEDEVAALSHGATDFVPKPYRPQVILHRVASLISLRENAAMVNQFKYDRLTGLYSKEYFYQSVRERLAQYPEREYSLICANIENFKLYNDAFGIPAGDRLLSDIANAFRTLIGEEGICGRYRADRFICLQERTEEYKHRIDFGQDGRYSFIVPEKNVVMKWGIYEINDDITPVELMCDRAILAADSIKGQYSKYYTIYDETLRSKLMREKSITNTMEQALDEKQFVVYFQPKYSLNNDCMAGAEALVRWIHPEWGFISPGEFIPLFEKNGFIPQLDQYVWEQVCEQLRDWKNKGYPLLPVSVNVSRADVYQTNLANTLQELTQKYGIDPAYLHLEITESAYTKNLGQVISTVEELCRRGFIMEMDDFGSGYSSLNMLSQMTVHILKLDMKFVQNEIAKPEGQSILNDIITMAHRLKLSVVAEGVETREQMERLRSVGCDYVQGYYLARPMPATKFEELLKVQPVQPMVSEPMPLLDAVDQRSVLVVDESEDYREKVREAFKNRYQVIVAADGESALHCIRSRGENGISAVILSMTLPGNDAAVVLKTLRQEPAFWKIPVLSTIPCGEAIGKLPLVLETDDFLCKCHPLFDLHRRVDRLLDMTALRKREMILQNEANRDHLTGLLNRRGLQVAMTSLRKEEQPLAVCLFDLDDLKKVNDTYGHETGDRLIQSFADLLRRQTRSEDIQCRYGGDEFVVILKQIRESACVVEKCTNICRTFRDCLVEEAISAACSAGVVLCGADEKPSLSLIERADQAMYHAKRENKGGCCLWEKQSTAVLRQNGV